MTQQARPVDETVSLTLRYLDLGGRPISEIRGGAPRMSADVAKSVTSAAQPKAVATTRAHQGTAGFGQVLERR